MLKKLLIARANSKINKLLLLFCCFMDLKSNKFPFVSKESLSNKWEFKKRRRETTITTKTIICLIKSSSQCLDEYIYRLKACNEYSDWNIRSFIKVLLIYLRAIWFGLWNLIIIVGFIWKKNWLIKIK